MTLEATMAAANKLIYQDQVKFLLGPMLPVFCNAMAEMSEENKVLRLMVRAPLMQGQIVDVEVAQKLAEKYQKSPAQIALRWNLQHEVVTIPKSVHPKRIKDNAQIFDFELSQSDMDMLDALDQGKHFGPDPANFNF